MSRTRIVEYVLIACAGLVLGVLGTIAILSGDTPLANEPHGQEHAHEHGEIAQSADDWCAEHRVPESQCTKCHGELIATFQASGDWCAEHDLPESHCRRCNPRLTFAQEPKVNAERVAGPDVFFTGNAADCATADAVIQFASQETAERSGIAVLPAVASGAPAREIEVPAELIFDETKSYALTSSLPATVVRWQAELGDYLAAGDPIADLDSPEMAALQADYLELLAESRFDEREAARADSLHQAALISAAEHQRIASEYAVTLARRNGLEGQLRAAGLSDAQIARLEVEGVNSRWTLLSARSGNLLERRAPLGLLQPAGTTMALLGDPRALWLQGHLRESDAARARPGQRVYFVADGNALERAAAEIFWVAPFVDSDSRTVPVRARLISDDTGGRARKFGRMILSAEESSAQVVVPKDAVQWEGCCNIVFVREDADRFRPRRVEIDRGDRGHYQVRSGLAAGELVVVKGGYLLKTELMKSSLGAGCAGH